MSARSCFGWRAICGRVLARQRKRLNAIGSREYLGVPPTQVKSPYESGSKTMTPPMNRRTFLGTTGGMLLAGGVAARPLQAAEAAGWPTLPPVKVYVVYLGTGGAWPKPEFDAPQEIQQKFAPHLAQVQTTLGDVQFVGGDSIPNDAQAAANLLAEDRRVAGRGDSCRAPVVRQRDAVQGAGRQLADRSPSTRSHSAATTGCTYRVCKSRGCKLILAPSRDLSEIDRLVALLRVPARMKQSKVILVGNPGCAAGTAAACDFDQVRTRLGPRSDSDHSGGLRPKSTSRSTIEPRQKRLRPTGSRRHARSSNRARKRSSSRARPTWR